MPLTWTNPQRTPDTYTAIVTFDDITRELIINHGLQAAVIVDLFDLSDYSLVPWRYSEQRDANTVYNCLLSIRRLSGVFSKP